MMDAANQNQTTLPEFNSQAPRVITPMMEQYLAIKLENPEGLLFYRMGDFYELFFEDAVIAARALDITLTKRGKHLGEDIPMCGVPIHSHENYLSRLIKKGYKVVVCEQTESPAEARKRGAKSVVQRKVVRTITSGTITEDSLLDSKQNNFLAALSDVQGGYGLAWLDMSTGSLQTQSLKKTSVPASLTRINPGELLISDNILLNKEFSDFLEYWKTCTTVLPRARFDSINGTQRLETLFKVNTLDAFGTFSRAELSAGGALIEYVELTQQGQLPRITPPKSISEGSIMEIDSATRRNLEITQTLSGERRGSLLSHVDQTLTGAGARLFARQISAPLTKVDVINYRLDMVEFFFINHSVLNQVKDHLKKVPDIERALSRLSLGRGGPRDLAVIREGLIASKSIGACLIGLKLPKGLQGLLNDFGSHDKLVSILSDALESDLPVYVRDGGFIAKGFSKEFDQLRELRDDRRYLISQLQVKYVQTSGVQGLKIKYNKVIGYFVEVSLSNSKHVPISPEGIFIHRQTMKNAVRYTTAELGELEGQIASAVDKALAMEVELYGSLVEEVLVQADNIALVASALAHMDVTTALAALAIDNDYSRPLIDESLKFEVSGGRHPVVEKAFLTEEDSNGVGGGANIFVKNDCSLDAKNRIWLITGPNMAGKSTFLRQNALIAVLAQMGSYVPADSVHLGLIDRLFSRVGAADDLARGRSTFMVEMVETATILSQATERSFVILDEIGRGTATFDGLSIAWAVIEYLYEINKSRALFATHYHELTQLGSTLDGITCHTVRVKEWNESVVFLHEVVCGTADRSYGIHVGQLAGLPASVVNRAKDILVVLENQKTATNDQSLTSDLPLFSDALRTNKTTDTILTALEKEVDEILPDELSPKEALELIYKLKQHRN